MAGRARFIQLPALLFLVSMEVSKHDKDCQQLREGMFKRGKFVHCPCPTRPQVAYRNGQGAI